MGQSLHTDGLRELWVVGPGGCGGVLDDAVDTAAAEEEMEGTAEEEEAADEPALSSVAASLVFFSSNCTDGRPGLTFLCRFFEDPAPCEILTLHSRHAVFVLLMELK